MSVRQREEANSKRLALLLGIYPTLGGLTALSGWIFNLRRATDWTNSGISQMPNSAIAVAAAGLALILLQFDLLRASRACALFECAIGVASLFENLTGIDLHIDRILLFHDWGQRGTLSPGRMGTPGSVCLSLLGIALLFASSGKRNSVAPILSVISMAVCALSLTGYFFGANPLYTIPRLTAIALQTSSMLFAISLGVVCAFPDQQPMRMLLGRSAATMMVRRGLAGTLILPLLLGWFIVLGQRLALFDTPFAVALLVLLLTLFLSALLWHSGNTVQRHEATTEVSRERLSDVMASISDAFFIIDPDFRLSFVNEEFARRAGERPSGLVGRSLWSVNQIVPDIREKLRTALVERRGVEYEFHLEKTRSWFAARAYPTSDGGLAIYSRDITEQRDAAKALVESERKFALLFDKSMFGAALAKLDGTFVDVNEAFLSIFGFTREEVVGSNSRQLRINRDEGLREEMLARLERDGFIKEVELTLYDRHGTPRTYLNNVIRIEIGGEPHLLTTVQDVTESRAAEQALRRSADALRAADRMKDEFLATLSHELRTPLTAIIGWTYMLQLGSLDKKETTLAFETILNTAKAQASLIDDVLDVSRITTGKMRLERKFSSAASIVEAAIAAVRPAAEARRIAVRFDVDRSIPPLLVDADRIQQVVWNLLSNAIKFSPIGASVTVRVRKEESLVIIEVEDEGCGIAPEFLPHVFERFRQADSSSTRSYSGLGLGLALAHDLVEMHGGTISAESELGKGSRFTIRLPNHETEGVGSDSEVASPPNGPSRLEGARVLYVDDREDARVLISRMLTEYGAKVIPAESVDEALSLLARESPDVVLTDLAMPDRDGYDLLASIQAERQWRDLPVLALSAQGRVEDEANAVRAGFAAYLRKPIEPEALASAVLKFVPPAES